MLRLDLNELLQLRDFIISERSEMLSIKRKVQREINRLNMPEELSKIIGRYDLSWPEFCGGDDLQKDLYEDLYEYFCSTGEMPYGVMKARTGDPFQWITDKMMEYVDD